MKPRVYIETTIPSYLTASPGHDPVRAARQQTTRAWWARQRGGFELVVSELVLEECAAGDPTAAAGRLVAVSGLTLLESSEAADALAAELIARVPFPPPAAADALHIATATVHGIEFLLTWNFAHMANAAVRRRVESACSAFGYSAPVICTPEELTRDPADADG